MTRAYAGHTLGQLLAEEGLLPKEYALVELHLPVDGIVQLHYTVNVAHEDLPKLARALAKHRREDNITKPNITDFLFPADSSEILAEDQAHLGYSPLPSIVTPDGKIASRWIPTPGELALLNEGVPVTLVVWTFNEPPLPVTVMVGEANLR